MLVGLILFFGPHGGGPTLTSALYLLAYGAGAAAMGYVGQYLGKRLTFNRVESASKPKLVIELVLGLLLAVVWFATAIFTGRDEAVHSTAAKSTLALAVLLVVGLFYRLRSARRRRP
jgi:Na+-driven multidrug efflux pump